MFQNVKPTKPFIWIPDAKVNGCMLCKDEFSFLNRKHHCRACGQIYCSTCCNIYMSLPNHIGEQRVCKTCAFEFMIIKNCKEDILIYSLLPLTLKEIYNLRLVCTKLRSVSDHIIGCMKSLQFKCAYQDWTGLERRLLQNHWREFSGHPNLIIVAFRGLCGILPVDTMVRYYKHCTIKKDCKLYFCSTECCGFCPPHIIEMMLAFPANQLLKTKEYESWVGQLLLTIDKKWLQCIFPWILQAALKSASLQRIVVGNLLPTISKDKDLSFLFYFECSFFLNDMVEEKIKKYYESLLSLFLEGIPLAWKNSIISTVRFLTILQHYDQGAMDTLLQQCDDIVLPYKTNSRVLKVQNPIQFYSHTKPWKFTVQTSTGEEYLLLKHDDLRKDAFTTSIIRILMLMIDLKIETYHVVPLSPTCGVVEMVTNTKTLFDLESSLQNYIIQNNMNQNMFDMRKIFLQSCASNCVVGYLLGIGDRNMKNILVKPNGTLIHVDFSYILGTDPKSSQLTTMKITHGMTDMLGGKDSEGFKKLQEECLRLISLMKNHISFWYTSFHFIYTAKPPIYPHYQKLTELKEHIETRLLPGVADKNLAIIIVDIVNSANDSAVAQLADLSHKFSDLIFNMTI